MFRNLRLYRVDSPWPDSEAGLAEVLSQNAFARVGKFSERSAGWEAPAPDGGLARRIMGADLLQLRTQSRILPAAAIKDALEDRVLEYRERLGEDPPRRLMRQLREETRDELLPQALVRSERTLGCFLVEERILAIDSLNPSKAEWFIDQLRPGFDALECVPLAFNTAPESLMRRLFLGEQPGHLTLGQECRLQDPSDSRATGTWRNIELDDANLRRHVAEGMRLTHLGLTFDHMLEFVMGEDSTFGKLKFVEGEGGESPESEDALTRVDADFVLFSGTLKRLLDSLSKLLGGLATAPA